MHWTGVGAGSLAGLVVVPYQAAGSTSLLVSASQYGGDLEMDAYIF